MLEDLKLCFRSMMKYVTVDNVIEMIKSANIYEAHDYYRFKLKD